MKRYARPTITMRRSGYFVILALLFLFSTARLRANDNVAAAQQTLKDQGFYYGEVTGRKDADTVAAIRRYQIRNGLKITGELNVETKRSLGIEEGAAASSRTGPSPTQEPANLRDDTGEEGDGRSRRETAPADRDQQPENASDNEEEESAAAAPTGDLFYGTPYEAMVPAARQRVVIDLQIALSRAGYYRHDIDGLFGPATAFALRAYQAQAGLTVNGRLDMETLRALRLLPGQHSYPPGRRVIRRWPRRPVYRGEWVPD
jgi:peptidoglycan hydrolase-like protein with peptidoglycan-binding domain